MNTIICIITASKAKLFKIPKPLKNPRNSLIIPLPSNIAEKVIVIISTKPIAINGRPGRLNPPNMILKVRCINNQTSIGENIK
jgi:hypothetical protein